MNETLRSISKPLCFLPYALAPSQLSARQANRLFNEFVADPALPLPLFHDHFIGQPGRLAIIYVEDSSQRDALIGSPALRSWHVEIQPLIFSFSPSALDEQISFTLRAYRNVQWDRLRTEKRPSYGNPAQEAETAEEDVP